MKNKINKPLILIQVLILIYQIIFFIYSVYKFESLKNDINQLNTIYNYEN